LCFTQIHPSPVAAISLAKFTVNDNVTYIAEYTHKIQLNETTNEN